MRERTDWIAARRSCPFVTGRGVRAARGRFRGSLSPLIQIHRRQPRVGFCLCRKSRSDTHFQPIRADQTPTLTGAYGTNRGLFRLPLRHCSPYFPGHQFFHVAAGVCWAVGLSCWASPERLRTGTEWRLSLPRVDPLGPKMAASAKNARTSGTPISRGCRLLWNSTIVPAKGWGRLLACI